MSRWASHRRYSAERLMALVEMMHNPPVVGCLKIVIGACLSHGIRVENATENFQKFVDAHYYPFAREAIRCMFFCGFVPWRLVRKDGSKKIVPECMPLGSFEWENGELKDGNPFTVKVSLSGGVGLNEKEIHVYQVEQPIVGGGLHHAPVSSLLKPYEMMCDAEEREISSDMWNTKAKLILAHTEKANMYRMNEGVTITADQTYGGCTEMFTSDYNDEDIDYQARFAKLHQSLEAEVGCEHKPDGITLPTNSRLEGVPQLRPVMNVEYLRTTFTAQVASVFGIPYEMVSRLHAAELEEKLLVK